MSERYGLLWRLWLFRQNTQVHVLDFEWLVGIRIKSAATAVVVNALLALFFKLGSFLRMSRLTVRSGEVHVKKEKNWELYIFIYSCLKINNCL